MRRWWLFAGLLLLSACAGPGQPPKTADILFPLPYILKGNSPALHQPAATYRPELKPQEGGKP